MKFFYAFAIVAALATLPAATAFAHGGVSPKKHQQLKEKVFFHKAETTELMRRIDALEKRLSRSEAEINALRKHLGLEPSANLGPAPEPPIYQKLRDKGVLE